MEYFNFFYLIIGILVGLITIAKAIKGLLKAKDHNKKFIILFMVGVVILGITGYGAYLSNIKLKKIKNYDKVWYELTNYRDKLYSVLSDYDEVIINNNGNIDINKAGKLLDETVKDFKGLEKVNVANLGVELRIYKNDHISYFGVIISSLESFLGNRERSIYWAKITIDSSQVALNLIEQMQNKYDENKEDRWLKKLLEWLEGDRTLDRLRYLRAMAFAIRISDGDQSVTPQHIKDEIGKISSTAFLIDYPLKENPHFENIKELFDEEFRLLYFGD